MSVKHTGRKRNWKGPEVYTGNPCRLKQIAAEIQAYGCPDQRNLRQAPVRARPLEAVGVYPLGRGGYRRAPSCYGLAGRMSPRWRGRTSYWLRNWPLLPTTVTAAPFSRNGIVNGLTPDVAVTKTWVSPEPSSRKT